MVNINSNADPDKNESPIPSALDDFDRLKDRIGNRNVALFLDYDGTLTSIVDSPEKALLSEKMRSTLSDISSLCPVAVISGRDLADVRKMVGIEGIYYAGSHGFDINGPEIDKIHYQEGTEYLPLLESVEKNLEKSFSDTKGIFVERKKFSIAVHYRKAGDKEIEEAEKAVDEIIKGNTGLKKSSGKKIFEIQPDIDWDKGKAIYWIMDKIGLKFPKTFPVYLGDDTTDEDAFRAIKGHGLGIIVMEQIRDTEAEQMLHDSTEVKIFLTRFTQLLKGEK